MERHEVLAMMTALKLAGITRRRRHLVDDGPVHLGVGEDDVGEGAADIDADQLHVEGTPWASRHGRPNRRARQGHPLVDHFTPTPPPPPRRAPWPHPRWGGGEAGRSSSLSLGWGVTRGRGSTGRRRMIVEETASTRSGRGRRLGNGCGSGDVAWRLAKSRNSCVDISATLASCWAMAVGFPRGEPWRPPSRRAYRVDPALSAESS